MRKTGLFLASIALSATLWAELPEKKGLDVINRANAEAYIGFLASDALEGREAGFRGGRIAGEYIVSNLKTFGIDKKVLNANDININALTSIKKDGTSGGVAFTTSIISLLLDKSIDCNICFTGEITLHGDIYKVGGIKEKLIGETFEYAPEFTYIINGLLMRYERYPELIRFLRQNSNLITSTFNKSGTRNLRILKHALNDFKKIFDMVSRDYSNTNNRIMQTMLIFTIAISFEIKAGKVTKDKFKNIENNEEYRAILVSSRVFMDNRQFYIKEFDNTYYYNFKVEYRFFKFIEIYVRTRIFDMKVFKDNMEVIRNTIDTDQLPGYKRLLTEEYWKISDDQFPTVIEQIIDDVKNGKIKPIEIVKIFAYFSYFIEKNLIDYDIQTIESVFINGMNIASVTSEYCEDAEEELSQIATEDAGPEMNNIIQRFYEINAQLKDKMYREKADELFKCIPMKMELFYDKFAKECNNIPIFKYYDPFQIFQRISCASNEDIVSIREMLAERAKHHKEEIRPEMENIAKLKQIMCDYIDGKRPTIKNVMIEEFAKELDKILKNNQN